MCEVLAVAIADDNAQARADVRAGLECYAAERGNVTLDIREYASGEALLANYRSDVDLVMLDVEMGDVDGFETARAIRNRDDNVAILFVTNMAQYAIRGYEVEALSYLLKPINQFALFHELDRCVARKRFFDMAESIVFSTACGTVRVPLINITYLECAKHKIIVHTVDGLYEFTGTLKSFLPQLEPQGFVMANSCYLVNLRYVTAIRQSDCMMRDDTCLAISRRRRAALVQAMGARLSSAA